jgi:hypothetical protein
MENNFNLKKFLAEGTLLKENQENSLENKIKQWVNSDAGGYGPDEDDEIYMDFKNEMNDLLQNVLEDFNPGNYGDSTTMSPDDILENFIENAIDIIAKYTMNYYGDNTSFSPEDIKNEFYEFVR